MTLVLAVSGDVSVTSTFVLHCCSSCSRKCSSLVPFSCASYRGSSHVSHCSIVVILSSTADKVPCNVLASQLGLSQA